VAARVASLVALVDTGSLATRQTRQHIRQHFQQ
jgi:hypothetical protein